MKNVRSVALMASIIVLSAIGMMSWPAASAQPTEAPAKAYQLDLDHVSIYFRIMHKDVSYVYGRFNDVTGDLAFSDANPGAGRFNFDIKSESVDTNNVRRDNHLRTPDFFAAKQFPTITFRSSAVEPAEKGYRVTGELTLHGTTKTIVVPLEKIGEADGIIGFATEFTIKRTDFGMTKMVGPVGDEVHLMISFEGK